MKIDSEAASVISLFSGAGGLDLGVEDAGGTIRLCVEPDPVCAATLALNSRYFPGAEILRRPIEEVSTRELLAKAGLRRGEVALLIGGPPCQPFSKAAYWLKERRMGLRDPRAGLLGEFVRVLREARPEGFVLENVASLLHPSNRRALRSVLRGTQDAGYTVEARLLHAVNYGIPQTRSRVFIIGLRGRAKPTFPHPTHLWPPNGNNGTRKLRPAEIAGRWIGHLDQKELFEPEEVVTGTWARQLRAIPPGWNYKALTAWARHRNPVFVAETRYWSFLLKLSPARPSWTIQATPGPWVGPFHWNSRRLRIPELAALQTFPRGYRFAGTRKQIVSQIGNAVPCLLACKVAVELLTAILGNRPRRGRRLQYRYCDEVPSEGLTRTYKGVYW